MKKNTEIIRAMETQSTDFAMINGKLVQDLLAELSPLVASSIEMHRTNDGYISIKLTAQYHLSPDDLDTTAPKG